MRVKNLERIGGADGVSSWRCGRQGARVRPAFGQCKATVGFALKDAQVIHRYEIGGADGVRTHDLLDAIEARSQLRHGPTEGTHKILPQYYG